MPHGTDLPPQGPERPLGRLVPAPPTVIVNNYFIELVVVLPEPEPPKAEPPKEPEKPALPKAGGGLAPMDVLREAIIAVPAVKWALGVGGLLAVVTLVYSFKLDPLAGFVGLIVLFVFMTILVIFARVSAVEGRAIAAPALVFTWFTLLMFMATTFVLFTSVFSNCPAPLRKWLTGENPVIPQWCPAQSLFTREDDFRTGSQCPNISGAWDRENRTQTITLRRNADCSIWGTLDTGAYFHEISGTWNKDHFDVTIVRTTRTSRSNDPLNPAGCKATIHGRYFVSDDGRQMTTITDRASGCNLSAADDPGASFTKK